RVTEVGMVPLPFTGEAESREARPGEGAIRPSSCATFPSPRSAPSRRRVVLSRKRERISSPPHKTVDDALVAGLVECDRQLVALDFQNLAIAEFVVEHA